MGSIIEIMQELLIKERLLIFLYFIYKFRAKVFRIMVDN